MEVGAKIKREREKAGLSRRELAARTGKDVSTIYRYETGGRSPSAQDMEDIAKAIGITSAELLAEGDTVYFKEWVQVPVLSNERQICKLFGTGAFELNRLEVEFYMMLPYMIVGDRAEEAFAVRAHGDSMVPEVPDGAICIVNANEPVADGDIALVCVNDALLVKRVYWEMSGRLELRSEDPHYLPKVYDQDAIEKGWVKVLGKIKAVVTIPKRKA